MKVQLTKEDATVVMLTLLNTKHRNPDQERVYAYVKDRLEGKTEQKVV
jgi:hypothetical protein